jgi:hypothetical protein
MLTLIEYERKGQYGRAWDMLLLEHQEVVSRADFDDCRSESNEGEIPAGAEFSVDEVYEETISVDPVGYVRTKAVTIKVTAGEESANITSHLVEREGEWKWILTPSDYEAFASGECPA